MQRRVMSAGESKPPALRRVVPRDDGVRGAQKRPLIDATATHLIKRAQLVKMFSIESHRRLPESQNDDVALALLDGGQPVVGCLGCPNLGTDGSLFYAAKGFGAHCGATHGAASEAFEAGADLATLASASRPLHVDLEPVGEGLVRCEAYEAGHSDFAQAQAVATAEELSKREAVLEAVASRSLPAWWRSWRR